MKKIYAIFICTTFILPLFAQNTNKVFQAFGFTSILDYAAAPVSTASGYVYNPSSGVVDTALYAFQEQGISLITLIYRLRFNLYEPQSDFAFGISATPAFGLTNSQHGKGFFNLPILAEIEWGAGATYNSSKDVGGFLGVGLEINKLDVIPMKRVDEPFPIEMQSVKNFWKEFVIAAGYRFWNKNNKLTDVNFKLGIGSKNDPTYALAYNKNDLNIIPPLTIRIAFIRFIKF